MTVMVSLKNSTWTQRGFVRVMVKKEREAGVCNTSGKFHLPIELLMCLDSVLLLLEDGAIFQGLRCQFLQRRENKCDGPEDLKNLLILYKVLEKGQGAYFESHLLSYFAKTIIQPEGGKVMRSHYPCAVRDVFQMHLFLCK